MPDNSQLFLHNKEKKPKAPKKAMKGEACEDIGAEPLFSPDYQYARLLMSISAEGENETLKCLLDLAKAPSTTAVATLAS